MAGHVHAALMAEYAEVAKTNDKPWDEFEYFMPGSQSWGQLTHNPDWFPGTAFRRKPHTININGFEVPEPLLVAPEIGSTYFIPEIYGMSGYTACLWRGTLRESAALYNGLIHKTPEAAQAHTKALLSFTTTVKE